jgi:hypothetical protein
VTDNPTIADDGEVRDGELEIKSEEIAKALNEAKRRREVFQTLRTRKAGQIRHYSAAPALLAAKMSATFDAHGITNAGGDPGIVGHLLVAFNRHLDAVGADVIMTGLHFLQSVTLDLQPVVSEKDRLKVEELAKSQGDTPLRAEDLRIVIPTSVIAIEAVADVLSQPPDRVAQRARALGADAREELRKLADELGARNATLTVVTPQQTVEVAPRTARVFAERLRITESIAPITIRIVGKLTRTDSEAAQFRVVLDPLRRPPELDGRRTAVEGGYTSNASRQVRDGGLWDTQVIADVRASMEVPPGGGKPRPAGFTFTDVEPAAG